MDSVRVTRKVKIGKGWTFAAVQLDRSGRPEAGHVLYKGERIPVTGGTFYLDHGHGKSRRRKPCGTDPEAVKKALKTQAHVVELRRRGMDVPDAPEIEASRRGGGLTLREMAKEFREEPPTGLTKKTILKYRNAFENSAEWAASVGVYGVGEVTKKTIGRWIAHMQNVERLDASTIVPKVHVVMAELKRLGNDFKLDDRSLPTIIEREREIYRPAELKAFFHACTLDEFERHQVFLQSGLRFREVAFLAWDDIDPHRCTIRVTAKRDLGFTPKTYHERTVPVPRSLIALLAARGERLCSDGVGLVFPTSRAYQRKGCTGGKADKRMLDKLKQIALRAGLNCGCCIGSQRGEAVSCKTHSVCKRWQLHKFRHTYATSMLRDKIDIVQVSKWLGHKDLATTRIYLHALEAETSQPQVERSTLATEFSGEAPAEGPMFRKVYRPKKRAQPKPWAAAGESAA